MHEYTSKPCVEDQYFPEGARWFAGALWWGDIHATRVMKLAADGRAIVAGNFGSPCSGVGFLADGTPIASLMQRRVLARINPDGTTGIHADFAPIGSDHINDIVTDAKGRVYVDCLAYHMHWFEPETQPGGLVLHRFQNKAAETPLSVTDQLVMVDTDGSLRVVATDLRGPNGLAISGDGRHLIVAEWRINQLTQFRIAADGSLSDRTLFAETAGLPDGICMDEEGAVWVASPTTNDCTRVLPGGHVTDRVKPTGHRVTACVLGGPNRRTLYLTTDEFPCTGSGRIESGHVEVPGAGYP